MPKMEYMDQKALFKFYEVGGKIRDELLGLPNKDEFSEKLLKQKLEIVKNKCRFYTKIVNELLNKDNNEVNSK